MTLTRSNAPARARLQQRRKAGLVRRAVAPILLGLGSAGSAAAQDSDAEEAAWRLLVEPMYMDAFGHDQQVLTVHEMNLDALPTINTASAVSLNTKGAAAFRFEVERRMRRDWDLGFDVFWFTTSQGRPARSASASGAIDQVVFDVGDRSFTSNDPGEQLSFSVLSDTDIAAWTVDAYAIKTLSEMPNSRLRLLLGVRNADFDNDFHAVAEIESAGGTLFEASSNYDRMIGPLIGFAGDFRLGRNTVRGYVGQSVVFGKTELARVTSDFAGPLADMTPIIAQETFVRNQDVSVPITDVRINWLHPIRERLSLGVALNASIWWDVPVPPGVVPATEGGGFNKNTIVFFGLGVAVQHTFR